jgi:hypothetical protein
MLLFFSIDVMAKIDQIHFGSKNTPLDGLTIIWRADVENCKIKWGYTLSYEKGEEDVGGQPASIQKVHYRYRFTFPLLEASKTIHYSFCEYTVHNGSIKHADNWTGDYTFQTSVDVKSGRFTFIAGGDGRGDLFDLKMKKWVNVVKELSKTDADFYLHTGDIVYSGGVKLLWHKWYDHSKDFLSKKLVYYCVGNHEQLFDHNLSNYLSQFVLPANGDSTGLYYSFEFGNAAFIILDTCTPCGKENESSERQTAWLKEQLEKYRGVGSQNRKEWVFLVFHKPFFSVGVGMGAMTCNGKGGRFCGDYSQKWWKDLFDTYGVDVIINGHTHIYMRSVPILLKGTGQDGRDIGFDKKGFPGKPVKQVEYGNGIGQGRLQVVSGGYGASFGSRQSLTNRPEWYIAKDNDGNSICYRLYHYCEFVIDGKVLEMKAIRIGDNKVIDRVTIKH